MYLCFLISLNIAFIFNLEKNFQPINSCLLLVRPLTSQPLLKKEICEGFVSA